MRKYAFILVGFLLCSCGKDDGDREDITPDDPVVERSSTTGINDFSTDGNIWSRNTRLPSNNAMQGFNFDSKGNIWYTQSGEGSFKHQLNIVPAKPNSSTAVVAVNSSYMRLAYFGHGTNTALEEVGDDVYLWVGAYASANAEGAYWGDKVIGRLKYVEGRTLKTNECEEYYHIGSSYSEMHPSIDQENDLLTINYNDPANGNDRCFVIYRLSEAKKAALTNVTIQCTDGFMTNNPNSTTRVNVTVPCRDLTGITPVARLKFRKQGYGKSGDTYYDWQGYEVHKDRLYYFEGQSNYNLVGSFFTDDVSQSYITVFDLSGKVIEERTKVAVISNRKALADIGVTQLGAMEAEGIKVHNGRLYLGYTSRGITQADTQHYQNIFVFNQSTKSLTK